MICSVFFVFVFVIMRETSFGAYKPDNKFCHNSDPMQCFLAHTTIQSKSYFKYAKINDFLSRWSVVIVGRGFLRISFKRAFCVILCYRIYILDLV